MEPLSVMPKQARLYVTLKPTVTDLLLPREAAADGEIPILQPQPVRHQSLQSQDFPVTKEKLLLNSS